MRPKTWTYFDDPRTAICDHCERGLNRKAKRAIYAAGLDFCNEDCATAHAVEIDREEYLDRPTREAMLSSKE